MTDTATARDWEDAAVYFDAECDDRLAAKNRYRTAWVGAFHSRRRWIARAAKAEAALGRALALCGESEQSNDEHDGFPDCYVDVRELRRALTAELAP